MTPLPETRSGASTRAKRRGRKVDRSRKGCPECRERKIKCDETRPECAQCLKSGRVCRLIDGLFRHHSFSFPPVSSPEARGSSKTHSLGLSGPADHSGSPSQPNDLGGDGDVNAAIDSPESPNSSIAASPQLRQSIPVAGLLSQSSPSNFIHERVATTSAGSLPAVEVHTSPLVAQNHPTVTSHAPSHTSIPASLPEENDRDCAEVGFFLRHFAEGIGQWIEISISQRSYFSQYVVQLASQSPLVRYSACAIAAKQLGQMKDFTRMTDITPRSRIVASALLEPGLDFLWYGAKYYEKAILLMARQISSHPSPVTHLSPGEIYQSTGSEHYPLHDHGTTMSTFQIISACILCAYEDLSATMRAWSGHLDGINKLLRPQIDLQINSDSLHPISLLTRGLDTSFWFFALNDMLNSLVLHQPCRLDPDDHALWQKMGLPIGSTGHLALTCIDEPYQEAIFFKALIRLLCKLVTQDCGVSAQWAYLDMEFTQWYHVLPTEFLSPITQTLPPSQCDFREPPLAETWYGSETCAISMAFFHMARILLLVNQPQELFLAMQASKPHDLLSIYNALQRDLNHHAMEIIAIVHGIPNSTVRKHMIQPLYFAGRCFSDSNERQIVVGLLKRIEEELGLFTEYRIKDLCEEWGVSFEAWQNH